MAKKKKTESSGWKSTLNKVVERSIQSVMAAVAQHSTHIIEWIKNLPQLKRKLRNVVIAIALSISGIIVLALGVANYLSVLLPGLNNGLSQIMVGAVLVLVAMLYVKMD